MKVRYWLFWHITLPFVKSPLGYALHAARHWDEMLSRNRYLQEQADGYLRAGNELRDDKKLLREALEIRYEGQQDQLELLLAEAEANMAAGRVEPMPW
jgi:hypothetical protein